MSLTFGERIGRIEERAVDTVFTATSSYVNEVSTYNGELGDRENLIQVLRSLTGNFPLVWVGYTGGEDEEIDVPGQSGAPLVMRHKGTLIVVCVADDTRGQYRKRKSGSHLTRAGDIALTHRMLSDVRMALGGLQLTATVGGEEEILNPRELRPLANEYIERITNITAVAVPFSFAFNYETTDRRVPGVPITEIHYGITPLTADRAAPGGTPGVHLADYN